MTYAVAFTTVLLMLRWSSCSVVVQLSTYEAMAACSRCLLEAVVFFQNQFCAASSSQLMYKYYFVKASLFGSQLI